MQEAYCLPRSKYTLCCSGWGPRWDLTWRGYPHPRSGWGVPHQEGWGYPHQDLMGVPPPIDGWGYPPVEVWTDTQTENCTFPHPSDAGGNKEEFTYCFSSVKVQKYFSYWSSCTQKSTATFTFFFHWFWSLSDLVYIIVLLCTHDVNQSFAVTSFEGVPLDVRFSVSTYDVDEVIPGLFQWTRIKWN